MIHLSTGTPGSGKTLNLLDLVEKECEGRTIYYRGIKDLKLDWIAITDEEFHKWYEFPAGSVFVADEVQQVWPRISHTRPSPDSVTRLDTHRHQGFDFYIVTQASRLLDSKVESFIDRHYHYVRNGGLGYTKRFAWEEFCKDVSSTTARNNAMQSRIRFNKKTFEKYKSAEVHTGKVRIPKPLIYLGLVVVALAAMVYKLSDRFTGDPEPSVSEMIAAPGIDFEQAAIEIESDPQTYFEQWTPRVPDVPYTAPAYDSVTQVKTFPRPQCIHSARRNICRCYSQQATRLAISRDACLAYIENGWFNPFKEESVADAAREPTQEARAEQSVTVASAEGQTQALPIVADETPIIGRYPRTNATRVSPQRDAFRHF